MRLRRFFFFVPLAALLAHCDFDFSPKSHTSDECELGAPGACNGNAVHDCEVVHEEEGTLQNHWVDRECDELSICVQPDGEPPQCVARPCASAADCDGRGLCRDGACAGYFGSYEECGADPERCSLGTTCATRASGEVDGGVLVKCSGSGCWCFGR